MNEDEEKKKTFMSTREEHLKTSSQESVKWKSFVREINDELQEYVREVEKKKRRKASKSVVIYVTHSRTGFV